MPDTIQIQVNGEPRSWRAGGTVADLLLDLDIRTERVAVELNLEILDRAAFADRNLRDGDRIEILSFIGGGSGAFASLHRLLQGRNLQCSNESNTERIQWLTID